MTVAPGREMLTRVMPIIGRAVLYAAGLLSVMIGTLWLLNIPVAPALEAIWTGAIGNRTIGTLAPLSATLIKTTPLLLTGLSVVVAWRSGMFSVGAEGQLLVGALASLALWSIAGRITPVVLIAMMLVLGSLAGALLGGLAGWLRVHRNVPEVISTIMLNYVALNVIGALVTEPGPLHGKTQSGPHSDPLPGTISLPDILPAMHSGVHLHIGIVMAIIAVPIVSLYLYNTRAGFGLRVVGQNPEAARVARLPIDHVRMQAMLVSGALSGLAGSIELLGVTGRLGRDFSGGWGYTAIPVALLGGLTPGGALFSALFFGALAAGCNNAQRTVGVPSFVAYVIQAATVLAVVVARAWNNRKSGAETD